MATTRRLGVVGMFVGAVVGAVVGSVVGAVVGSVVGALVDPVTGAVANWRGVVTCGVTVDGSICVDVAVGIGLCLEGVGSNVTVSIVGRGIAVSSTVELTTTGIQSLGVGWVSESVQADKIEKTNKMDTKIHKAGWDFIDVSFPEQ